MMIFCPVIPPKTGQVPGVTNETVFLFLVVFIIRNIGCTIPAVAINQGPILYLPFEDADNPVDHSDNPARPKINGKLE